MNQYALAEVSFRVGHGDVLSGCSGPGCTVAETAMDPMVAVATVIVSVTFLLAFAYVRDAREICNTERENARAEYDSFQQFEDRTSALDTGGTTLSTTGATQSIAGTAHDSRLDRVRDAYRDTVMDVPHYDAEYGDSLPESMAEEFGTDVAAAVCRGDTLSPQLQRTLVARSDNAAARREELDDAIETELNALEQAASDLERLERERRNLVEHVDDARRFDAAADVWQRLGDIDARVEDVVSDRQEQLRDPPMKAHDGLPSFHEYLYDQLETTYPILAAATELVECIREDRKRMMRTLTETT